MADRPAFVSAGRQMGSFVLGARAWLRGPPSTGPALTEGHSRPHLSRGGGALRSHMAGEKVKVVSCAEWGLLKAEGVPQAREPTRCG